MKLRSENCIGERARPGCSSSQFASNFRDVRAQANWFVSRADCSARGHAELQPGRLRSPFVLVATILIFAGSLFAADVAADFSAANELYAKGRFADAAAAYEKLLQTGVTSPALLFNAANAAFKSGHLGKAIAAYRQAELLAPRDAELRANLAFVRNQVQGAALRESRWQNWIGSLSLNEGTLLAAFSFWAMFALLAARQIRPALAPKLRSATHLAVGVAIVSGAVLALQAANHFNAAVAVVTGAETTARSGPFDEAQGAFTAHDGAELQVLDHHDDWVQVANGAGKVGWLSRKQVEVLPGG
jgi:tetratricopeptide (TPR) repeat protein